MVKTLSLVAIFLLTMLVSGCSVFGRSSVEIAPYQVLQKQQQFELRHYSELILVSTPMRGMQDQSKPFRKLFAYISGENQQAQKIEMTAPVFLNQIDQITETMSFVLPADFALSSAPVPNDANVQVERITDYTVAVVRFSGRLNQKRIEKFTAQLKSWIEENNLSSIGAAKAAGYNPPFTLPAYRRNEVLIPVKKISTQ